MTQLSPILKGSDYLFLPRGPETWLIEPLLPAGGLAMLYGDPKVGKSYAAIQLALGLHDGTGWLGFRVPRPSRTVYIQLDTPRSLWGERLDALAGAGVVGIDDLFLADKETLNTWPFDILRGDHQELLRNALRPLEPDCVIIDTLREAHSGDENESTAMKAVVSSLVAAVHPAALILIHHSKKPSLEATPDLIHDMRGGYIAGAMDAIIKFSKKGVHFVGRSIEQGFIAAERQDNGFWSVAASEIDHWLPSVLDDRTLTTVTAQAEALMMLTNQPLEACRAAVRRVGRRG